MTSSQKNIPPLITVNNPTNHTLPVVISIPHSGTYVPQAMRDLLKPGLVLPNSDWYLPQLYQFLEPLGFTVLQTEVSRYVIDVNRGRIQEGDSYKTNLVYTHTTQGDPMYHRPPTHEEIQYRVESYYLPYHAALERAIKEKLNFFSTVYVLDLHSFGLDYGAHIILGDNHGKSCTPTLSTLVKAECTKAGFTVRENDPFSGGYITKHYGCQPNCEALQLELWYQAYIDVREFGKEEQPEIDPALFRNAQDQMQRVFENLADTFRCATAKK